VDLEAPVHAEELRGRVRAFLRAELPREWSGLGALSAQEGEAFQRRWRNLLYRHRFLAPTWPSELGGGGLTDVEAVVLAQELAEAGVPAGTPNDVFSIGLVGNAILRFGKPAQKGYFLPRILSGEDVWCQGFSEPDAGSDLGDVALTARLDGDEWVLNGQKIWTSRANLANWIFVLARTGARKSRHGSISFLLVPLDQPGIERKPIRQLNGTSEFFSTFFTDARTARENILGDVDGGWAVAMSLLGQERGQSAATLPIELGAELGDLLALSASSGRSDDPVMRQRLAQAYIEVQVMRYLGLRALTRFLRGEPPGVEGSITKLSWSEYRQRAAELALDVLGPEALTPGPLPPGRQTLVRHAGTPNTNGTWVGAFYFARAGTIYQGSSEVQRNIIAERVLGLPKEIRP
jgi:alkylation response protein AidB-like acyl-CoA dehydrogenase